MNDTLKTVIDSVLKDPVVYVNAGAVAISMTDIEVGFKIATYIVTIITSIIVSIKYINEIKKLRKENEEIDRARNH